MRQTTNLPTKPRARSKKAALAEYIAALEEFYPAAKGAAEVVTRADKMIVVNIPLP
jgi:hypothetical protein